MKDYTGIKIMCWSSGQYLIHMVYRGKNLMAFTNNMPAVEDYLSEPDERDGRVLRKKRGYEILKAGMLRLRK